MGGEGPCGFLVALRVRKGDSFLGFSTYTQKKVRKGNFPGAPVA